MRAAAWVRSRSAVNGSDGSGRSVSFFAPAVSVFVIAFDIAFSGLAERAQQLTDLGERVELTLEPVELEQCRLEDRDLLEVRERDARFVTDREPDDHGSREPLGRGDGRGKRSVLLVLRSIARGHKP